MTAAAAESSGFALLSVDIGTSGAKALLCGMDGSLIVEAAAPYLSYYPAPGLAEQDADEVAEAVAELIGNVMLRARIDPGRIAAVVCCGIWQSLLAVDAAWRPLGRALIWADRRSAGQNERLRSRIDPRRTRLRTGCSLHPMYHPSRIAWWRDEAPELFRRIARFVSIKEYVLYRLFGVVEGDRSTASGTGLWNLEQRDWDAELLEAIGLERERLPDLVEPTALRGGLRQEYAARTGLRAGTPVVIGAADGAHAHLGSTGLAPQRLSLSFGTSAALRAWCAEPRMDPDSESWCYYLAEDNWLLGGVVHDAGNALRWFADNLMPPDAAEAVQPERERYDELNALAASAAPGAEGVRFLPLFAGERSPHYRPDATATLSGLTFGHTRAHIARALFEGLAYNLYSVYRMLVRELGREGAGGESAELVVTGGIVRSPVLLQIVSDLFGMKLWRSRAAEAAAWGGVLLGLRSLGATSDLRGAVRLVEPESGVAPRDPAATRRGEIIASYDALFARLYGG